MESITILIGHCSDQDFYYASPWKVLGHAVAQLVEALRYKSEGRHFDFRWCHGIFYMHNPSVRTMALGLTQPLTEMSTRNISCG